MIVKTPWIAIFHHQHREMFAQTKLAIQWKWATRLFQMPRFCFSSILFSEILKKFNILDR